jgi:hypothetical protein
MNYRRPGGRRCFRSGRLGSGGYGSHLFRHGRLATEAFRMLDAGQSGFGISKVALQLIKPPLEAISFLA